MDDLLAILEQCSLFNHKSPQEIRGLLSDLYYQVISFKENEVVFSPFQNADKMGIILSGAVDVQKIFPMGKVVIIARKKSPELIAEASIFSKLGHYPDTVVTCKPGQILFISKAELLQVFARDKDIMLNLLEAVANSTLMLKHKIGILSLDSIQEKIAGFLLHANKHDCDTALSNMVTLPFSKKDWAEYMNVSRTSLSRELRKLEVEGIITFNKRVIEIKDVEGLQRILSL